MAMGRMNELPSGSHAGRPTPSVREIISFTAPSDTLTAEIPQRTPCFVFNVGARIVFPSGDQETPNIEKPSGLAFRVAKVRSLEPVASEMWISIWSRSG